MRAKRIILLLIATGLVSVVIAVGSLLYRQAIKYADFEADRFGFPYYWIEHVKVNFAGRADYWGIETSNLAMNIVLFFLVSIAVLSLSLVWRERARRMILPKQTHSGFFFCEPYELPQTLNELIRMHELNQELLETLVVTMMGVKDYAMKHNIPSPRETSYQSVINKVQMLFEEISGSDEILQRKKSGEDFTEPFRPEK